MTKNNLSGDIWGGFAAMLVALPSAIAFGVTIFSPLGADFGAKGALAGMLGVTALGLIAATFGGTQRLISAPCAPAAAVLSALTIQMTQHGSPVSTVVMALFLVALASSLFQILFGVLRVGELIKYMPFPVVSGYLSGGPDHCHEPIAQVDGLAQGHELVGRFAQPSAVANAEFDRGCCHRGCDVVGPENFYQSACRHSRFVGRHGHLLVVGADLMARVASPAQQPLHHWPFRCGW